MDGSLDPATMRELVGKRLTPWFVPQDGSRVRLGFADGDGNLCRASALALDELTATAKTGREHMHAPLAARVLN